MEGSAAMPRGEEEAEREPEPEPEEAGELLAEEVAGDVCAMRKSRISFDKFSKRE